MDSNYFANALRQRRRSLGVTQTESAVLLGVSASLVSKWELGDRNPSVEQIPRLADHLEISEDEVWELIRGERPDADRMDSFVKRLRELEARLLELEGKSCCES